MSYPHFTDEATETQRKDVSFVATQLARSNAPEAELRFLLPQTSSGPSQVSPKVKFNNPPPPPPNHKPALHARHHPVHFLGGGFPGPHTATNQRRLSSPWGAVRGGRGGGGLGSLQALRASLVNPEASGSTEGHGKKCTFKQLENSPQPWDEKSWPLCLGNNCNYCHLFRILEGVRH